MINKKKMHFDYKYLTVDSNSLFKYVIITDHIQKKKYLLCNINYSFAEIKQFNLILL